MTPHADGTIPPPCSARILELAVLAHCRHELGRIYDEGRWRCGDGPGELTLEFGDPEEMMHTVVRDTL